MKNSHQEKNNCSNKNYKEIISTDIIELGDASKLTLGAARGMDYEMGRPGGSDYFLNLCDQ